MYAVGTSLCTEGAAENKMDKVPGVMKLLFQCGKTNNKQTQVSCVRWDKRYGVKKCSKVRDTLCAVRRRALL